MQYNIYHNKYVIHDLLYNKLGVFLTNVISNLQKLATPFISFKQLKEKCITVVKICEIQHLNFILYIFRLFIALLIKYVTN